MRLKKHDKKKIESDEESRGSITLRIFHIQVLEHTRKSSNSHLILCKYLQGEINLHEMFLLFRFSAVSDRISSAPPTLEIARDSKFALFEIIYQVLLIMWTFSHFRFSNWCLLSQVNYAKTVQRNFFSVCFLIWHKNDSDGSKNKNTNRLNKKLKQYKIHSNWVIYVRGFTYFLTRKFWILSNKNILHPLKHEIVPIAKTSLYFFLFCFSLSKASTPHIRLISFVFEQFFKVSTSDRNL